MTAPTQVPTVLSRRDAFLRAFILQNGTTANAEDVNEIQRRVEEALQAFGSDVDYSLDQLVLILSAFTTAIRREQSEFQTRINKDFESFKADVDRRLEQVRQDFASADAATLKSANKYTDDAVTALKKLMVQNSKTTVGVTTPEMYDGGITSAGKDYPVTVYTVPAGHTFYVHRWVYSHRCVAGPGYLTSYNIKVTWPNFLGFQDYSAQYQGVTKDSGAFADKPLFTMPAGASSTASVFVNNVKEICTFTLEGYLIPDGLDT